MSEPIRVSQAAGLLGVDRGTVYRYVRDGWLVNRGTPGRPMVILEEAVAAGVGLRVRRARLAGAEPADADPMGPAGETAEPTEDSENYSEPVPAGAGLVGVNEAGRRLGIDPGQISRQIKAGIIPNRGGADRPLINVDEARQARAVGLDRSKQRGPGAPLFTAPSQPVLVPAGGAPPSSAQADNETYQSARARRESVSAQMAEMNLMQRKGELLRVEDAEREWGEALARLVGAIDQFIVDLPGKLGLGRDAVDICRREWRAFRQRQADQAREAGGIDAVPPPPLDPGNPFSGPPAPESGGPH